MAKKTMETEQGSEAGDDRGEEVSSASLDDADLELGVPVAGHVSGQAGGSSCSVTEEPKSLTQQKRALEREFPAPFYCTITGTLMKDPVVDSTGQSYERGTILKREDVSSDKLHPNRALLQVMHEETGIVGASLHTSWLSFQRSVRSITEALEKKIFSLEEEDHHDGSLPESFFCPITFDLIHVPVIDPEGNTFERAAIENWIIKNGNSPITRKRLTFDQLYPNKAISKTRVTS